MIKLGNNNPKKRGAPHLERWPHVAVRQGINRAGAIRRLIARELEAAERDGWDG
uniref:hypothetical protein n=1 Tax=Komagataeibacter piraceti TaxID=3229897 RepID=UPI003B5BD05C